MCDLVKNILGPRGGPNEKIAGKPVVEYITGILSPVEAAEDGRDAGPEQDAELAGSSGSAEGDADTGPAVTPASFLSPALDPKKTPSSMGMTFSVAAAGGFAVDVCVTWARYAGIGKDVWERSPRFATFRIDEDTETVWIGGDGGRVGRGDAEISLSVRSGEPSDGVRPVSVYVVNRVKVPDGQTAKSDHHIFQPQIRIVCAEGTRIVPGRGTGAATEEERENEVVYGGKESLAKGHMTSAVWKDVDPEVNHPDAELDFPECAAQPGFSWADGELLPGPDRARFSSCDARTEFVPMHNVKAPDFAGDGYDPRQLDPSAYAEEYDGKELRKLLEPFALGYGRWVDELRGSEAKHGGVKDRIVRAAEDTRRRMKLGIELICEDDDARLAFCFANRAMHEQARWAKREGMLFRPFQLAFILTVAESALNPESKDRGTCDLLWVPTGGGKTEAYLFLVSLIAAHRRLRAAKSRFSRRPGEGVSVISRYTLRLLTIQQFRRTVSLFAAMEYLRVHGLGKKGGVGWRPRGLQGGGDFLWGTAPFSVGLWVGNAVTPNKMERTGLGGSVPGALDILGLPDGRERGDHGEPAQMLECPACGSVLATPKMGLKREAEIHYVILGGAGKLEAVGESLKGAKIPHVKIVDSAVTKNRAEDARTLSLKLRSDSHIRADDLARLWSEISRRLEDAGAGARLAPASASRPGYFVRNYASGGKLMEYDFDVFCPNPGCQLVTAWAGGAPLGRIHGRAPGSLDLDDSACGVKSPDGNYMTDVVDAFAVERSLSDRIPIPALTVDEQLYGTLPTMIVSTVDKFARIPFEPRSGALFGNADHYNCVRGYYREHVGHPSPSGRGDNNYVRLPYGIRRPDLIIQDELHLIDGPLGSMVGAYESAVERLCAAKGTRVKYIASTATSKRSGDHVKSLFAREFAVFPPKGLDADDRFFVRGGPAHPLLDRGAGQLYLGVCAPGRSAIVPIIRVWSRLAQSAHERHAHPSVDPFWTIVGYFNTIRELAGARALYRQDIPEWMRHLAKSDPRPTREEGGLELSGRTQSTDLPSILDRLGKEHPGAEDALDGLFTTSMFGTGVDVQRLGIMLVNGQPKTSSAYIQATGRVGRKSGAIVVTLHRASKPRDLNHYEFFVRHHSQLHRFVEPPTVFPFSKRVVEKAGGPIAVGILRNVRRPEASWAGDGDAPNMRDGHGASEVVEIPGMLESRAQEQPDSRRPPKGHVKDSVLGAIESWRNLAEQGGDLRYVEYAGAEKSVVLGDPRHEHSGAAVVYSNSPQSMRDTEEETGFET